MRAATMLASTAILAALIHDAWGFVDTEEWVGAEYTPAAAPGNGYVRAGHVQMHVDAYVSLRRDHA
eukprot:COSAG02_NODE_6397_length_3599_cov_8.635143_2_plen_66_part_00